MLEFFNAVLPDTGPYCIAFKAPGKQGFVQRPCRDAQRMLALARWGSSQQWDTYFCVSSLAEAEWIDSAGKRHIRKKENIKECKVLILDVDVKPDKPQVAYASKDEALKALEKFNRLLKFPKPLIVDSGYGLHVYWVMEKGVWKGEWVEAARLFKQIAVKLDLKLANDTTRMADYAGVLRVPGTANYKDREKPQLVTILQWHNKKEPWSFEKYNEEIKTHAKGLGIRVVEGEKPFKDFKPTTPTVDLSLETPHRIDIIARKCNQVKQYIANIATADEPFWYRMLGLLKHCYHPNKSQKEIVHAFSKGHPGYSPRETEKKYEQVRAAQSGPTLCETFRSQKPSYCEGCPYACFVVTPAQLDTVDLPETKPIVTQAQYTNVHGTVVTEEITQVSMPKPYFRGKDGGIYMNLDGGPINGGENTAIRKIYDYDIYPVARLQNEDTGEEELEVHLHLPKDGKKVIRIPNEVTSEPGQFVSYLTARGVLLKKHEVLPLVSYMVDFAKEIQRETPAHGVYARFGWRDPQELNAKFVLGDGVIEADGSFHACATASWLGDKKVFAMSKGSLKKWKEAFNAVKEYSPMAYQFVAALGFAAPLFALSPYKGLLFNLKGESGIGKSTALQFMTSIWGKPTMTHIIKADNSIPVYNKIGYLNSIPVAYDEITNLPPDQTSDFAYGISEGRGKERAGRDGQTKTNYIHWSTCVVGCSNLSLYEKIAASRQGNSAPAYRIFEVEVNAKDIKILHKEYIDEALRTLDENYGIAGRTYMQAVMQSRTNIIKEIQDQEIILGKQFKLKSAERFWGGMFACVSVALKIINELGLFTVSRDAMLVWMKEELEKVRKSLGDSQGNAVNVLSDFINSNLHATLFVNDGKVNAYGLSNTPTRELHIRLERTKGMFTEGYISLPAFKKYCNFNRIECAWVIKDLINIGVVKTGPDIPGSKRLGRGTEFEGGPVSIISLNFNSPYLQEDKYFNDDLREKGT